MDEETIFYENGQILVSTARITFWETTYPTANLTSVSVFHQKPKRWPAIVLLVFGVLLLIGGFSEGSSGSLIPGMVAFFAGVIWLMLMKTRYWLRISVASGDKRVLRSEDGSFVQELVDAIHRAIVARG